METGTFANIVAARYKDITSLFRTRVYNMNMIFNEDLFHDTFIKCANKFNTESITYEIAIKYFWIAYVNTVKSELIEEEKTHTELLDEELHDCIDNTYNELYDEDYSKDIYNKVMKAVSNKYGETEMIIYSLYKYHNWTEADLKIEGYDCKDLKNRVKAIHRFVKTYSKKHIIK